MARLSSQETVLLLDTEPGSYNASIVRSSRERAPVFIVGSARSGNTMLYSMLLSSGRFPVYRAEPCVFDLLVPRFGNLGTAANRRKFMANWIRTRQFRVSGLDSREITRNVISNARTGGEFLCMVMDEVACTRGFRRWAVWGPDNLLYLPTIKRQIPHALFIHVIRDGRDVACAMDKKKFISPFPWDRQYTLYASALHWKWKVETGRRQRHTLGASYLELRYEDLVLHPEETLRVVQEFIREPLDYASIKNTKLLAMGAPNTSFPEELQAGTFSPVGRWRRQLSEEEITGLEVIIGDLLVELGYPLHTQARASFGARLKIMRRTYPAFFQLKEWLKIQTPMGRFVSLSRLHMDETDDVGEQ